MGYLARTLRMHAKHVASVCVNACTCSEFLLARPVSVVIELSRKGFMKRRPEFACPLFALTLLMFTLGSLHSHVVLGPRGRGAIVHPGSRRGGAPVTDLTAEDFVIQQGDVDCTVIRVGAH